MSVNVFEINQFTGIHTFFDIIDYAKISRSSKQAFRIYNSGYR